MIKFLKDLWMVCVEQAKAKKACRLLIQQEWSIEFLVLLLAKTVKIKKCGVWITLKNKTGQELILSAEDPRVNAQVEKDKGIDILSQNISLDAVLEAAYAQGMM